MPPVAVLAIPQEHVFFIWQCDPHHPSNSTLSLCFRCHLAVNKAKYGIPQPQAHNPINQHDTMQQKYFFVDYNIMPMAIKSHYRCLYIHTENIVFSWLFHLSFFLSFTPITQSPITNIRNRITESVLSASSIHMAFICILFFIYPLSPSRGLVWLPCFTLGNWIGWTQTK